MRVASRADRNVHKKRWVYTIIRCMLFFTNYGKPMAVHSQKINKATELYY